MAAALPRLPFADGAFALTLSSYLLFAYPALFSPAEQLAALRELVRVTDPTGEVRIHPLHDSTGRPYPRLDALRAELGRHQVATEIRRYGRPGTHRVLVLRAADHRRRAAGLSAGRARPDRVRSDRSRSDPPGRQRPERARPGRSRRAAARAAP